MVAITNQQARPSRHFAGSFIAYALVAVEVAVALGLGRLAWWWVMGMVLVALIELRGLRERGAQWFWSRLPGLVVALSVVMIVALAPRFITQVGVAGLFGLWLVWRERQGADGPLSLVQLLIVQAVMFEAIFLAAAIWRVPALVTLILVWVGAYLTVYGALTLRKDRSAGVMAASWGVIATEVAWILSQWLITYTMNGGYILVPQPALILTALAYVYGSILASSRQGNLSRGRLGEYLLIGAVLVLIVVVGTSWRGNV